MGVRFCVASRALAFGWLVGVFGVGALLMLPATASALEQTLVAARGGAGEQFGRSVAIDGDTAVVGAAEVDGGRGAVYVFTRSSGSWRQSARLTAADGMAGDELGCSVAIEGDTIVAGALRAGVGASAGRGAAYTFARTGKKARTQTAKLTAADGEAYDLMGSSVAIDGDTIVAGAIGDDGATLDQGSAYTFARTGAAARTNTAKLTAGDAEAFDAIGRSVAISGDRIVVGAPQDDIAANANQGSVYVFTRTGAVARTQSAKLTASDGQAGSSLAFSVAISADTIIAGAYSGPEGGQYRGAAYTFARDGVSERTQTATLTASDGQEGDSLGYSVAIDADTIVVGALGDDIGANANQGAAYTFTSTGAAARTQTAKLTAAAGAAGDAFAFSVAIDAGTIMAGAPWADRGSSLEQGTVSVFSQATPPGGGT